MSNEYEGQTPPPIPGRRSARAWRSVVVLALFGSALYVPGINWGLPAITSWSQDTVAGMRTLGAVETWPRHWRGRYPPWHYLMLRAVYAPYLNHLVAGGQAERDPMSGRVQFKPPAHEKVGALILIARCVSVLMAIGALLCLYLAGRRWLDDDLAAMIGAGAFGSSAVFVYFAHLGNVDVPSMFWFACSVVFYVRLQESRLISDAVLLGLCGSLAISTKDSVAGMYPGMAIVLLIAEARRVRGERSWFGALGKSLARWRWLAGIAAFVLPYLVINGVFQNPEAYLTRMRYWLGFTQGTTHMHQYRYGSQFALFVATLRYAAGAVGWPMLVALIAATAYAIRRHARTAWIVLAPACTYYLIVIVPQDFVYSRFLFPPLALIALLVGVAGRDLLRARCVPVPARFGVVAVIAFLTLGYTAAIDLEMIGDSRYAAEAWFEHNVDKSTSVGAFSKPQYLPRLAELGYPTYGVEMKRETFDRPQPDYLVLTNYNYEDFDEPAQACKAALVGGELGYGLVATFRGRYLGTGSSWLNLAGWGTPVPGKISPTVVVMKRDVP